MSYFDRIYAKLFGKETNTPFSIQEVIKRSDRFLDQFNSWKSSDACQKLLSDVWQSYSKKRKGIDVNPNIYILDSQYSNGFSISYESQYEGRNFHFLFDYLAEQVKKLDYRLVMSRLTITEKDQNVETKELHYLKPKRGFVAPIDQKFGNVQIEYTMLDDYPDSIRLIANGYPDRKYTEVKKFHDLAQHLFNLEF